MGKTNSAKSITEDLYKDLAEMYDFRNDVVRGIEEFSIKGSGEWRPFESKSESEIGARLVLERNWNLSYKKFLDLVIYGTDLMKEFNEIKQYFDKLEPLSGLVHYNKLVCSVNLRPIENSKININSAFDELLMQWLIGVYCSANGIQKNDVSLILIGTQGTGKTMWLNSLCPKDLAEYLYSGSIDPSNKDHQNYLSEKFLINLDDCLTTFFQRRGHDELKNFITASDVDNRKAYARNSTKRKRIASIVGTVNDANFLTDVENRRYLCFEILKAKHWEGITPEFIEKVWREIKFQVVELKKPFLWNSEQVELQTKLNLRHTELTIEHELLIRYFQHPKDKHDDICYMQHGDILTFLQGRTGVRLNSRSLTRALERAKFIKTSKRFNDLDDSRKCYQLTPTKYNNIITPSDYRE